MIEMPTEADPVRVICGDALAVLPTLPDGCVDAVITDPPYSEKAHAGARTRTLTGHDAYSQFADSAPVITFDHIDEAAFIELCACCVTAAKRWVLMTCDWRHASAAAGHFPGEFVRCGVWVKPDSAPQFSGDRPGTGWEAVAVLHRKGRKRWNGGGLPAVWRCGIARDNDHPTQKPLKLVREWVRLFTDPGDLILDPFAGSGTTGVAAIAEGRRAILIEKDPKYAELCRKRVAESMGMGVGSLLKSLPKPDLFSEVV